jgi:hypothetical protein
MYYKENISDTNENSVNRNKCIEIYNKYIRSMSWLHIADKNNTSCVTSIDLCNTTNESINELINELNNNTIKTFIYEDYGDMYCDYQDSLIFYVIFTNEQNQVINIQLLYDVLNTIKINTTVTKIINNLDKIIKYFDNIKSNNIKLLDFIKDLENKSNTILYTIINNFCHSNKIPPDINDVDLFTIIINMIISYIILYNI